MRRYFENIISGMAGALIIVTLLAWSYDYDKTTPPDTGESPRLGASRIRELKNALQERLNVDHYAPYTGDEISDANAGIHRQVTFYNSGGDDPNINISATDPPELYWHDKTNTKRKLTNEGKLYVIAGDYDANSIDENDIRLSNTGVLKARNAGDDGDVALIYADANDVAVVPDNSQTATNAAPTSTTGIVNKKYVDDNIGSAYWTPTDYTADVNESITVPNNFIMKFGYEGRSASNERVTFDVAFPNSCLYVYITPRDEGEQNISYAPYISDKSTTGFDINCTDTTVDGHFWMAVGY